MTSVLKRYSQIDARIRYFANVDPPQQLTTYTITNAPTTGVVDIADVTSDIPLSAPLVKDLGRTIYVYDSSVATQDEPIGPQVAVLRQVQVVNGSLTEGVGGTAAGNFNSYWIATWVSGGSVYPVDPPKIILARVARTG